jgi:4Fe-4S ferredoxin
VRVLSRSPEASVTEGAELGAYAELDLPPGSPDLEKARRAARDPARPGEKCRANAGTWVPIVDQEKCEGKVECVAVCPYSVFELGTLTEVEYSGLGYLGRMKAKRHDFKTARTPLASSCRACGLCVIACPEDAITLRRADGVPQ